MSAPKITHHIITQTGEIVNWCTNLEMAKGKLEFWAETAKKIGKKATLSEDGMEFWEAAHTMRYAAEPEAGESQQVYVTHRSPAQSYTISVAQ